MKNKKANKRFRNIYQYYKSELRMEKTFLKDIKVLRIEGRDREIAIKIKQHEKEIKFLEEIIQRMEKAKNMNF